MLFRMAAELANKVEGEHNLVIVHVRKAHLTGKAETGHRNTRKCGRRSANYLGIDRADLQFATKEARRDMSRPIASSIGEMKRSGR